jgi:drug/metabolite transporter (DMT)-like permease
MDLTAALAVILAALVPFVAAVFTRPDMSATQKRIIAGSIAAGLGVIVAVTTGKVTGVPSQWIDSLTWLLVTVAVVISLAQGYYSAFKGMVKSLEVKTTPAIVPSEVVDTAADEETDEIEAVDEAADEETDTASP